MCGDASIGVVPGSPGDDYDHGRSLRQRCWPAILRPGLIVVADEQRLGWEEGLISPGPGMRS